MQVSGGQTHQLDCPLAHELIDKLSIIIGYCDLLVEKVPEQSPLERQARMIQNTAKSMAADLAQFQCDLARIRGTQARKAVG
jgi:hypothetical protein